jgi:hypothetical protein
MTSAPLPTVSIDFNPSCGWTVTGHGETLRCRSLDEARRRAASTGPCELVVHDAYHRVIRRERLDVGCPPPGSADAERDARFAL